LGANFLSEYGIVLDFKEQCLHYEMGRQMRKQLFDRFQEVDFEASNSEVAKNCVVRHTCHTHVAPPLKDRPRAICCVPGHLEKVCEAMREVSGYERALGGKYEERESRSKVDIYCKTLKKGNGLGKRTLCVVIR
jgi:hypothetical protein